MMISAAVVRERFQFRKIRPTRPRRRREGAHISQHSRLQRRQHDCNPLYYIYGTMRGIGGINHLVLVKAKHRLKTTPLLRGPTFHI